MNQNVVIPLWLRDIYAIIQEVPLYSLQDNENVNERFIEGNNIINYIYNSGNNLPKNFGSYTITFIISNLRNLYWNNKNSLREDDRDSLSSSLKYRLPKFEEDNIFDNIVTYKLNGTITPFNILTISVRDFVERINKKLPIDLLLDGTNVIISIRYEKYDFWNESTQSIIDNVRLN